VKNLPKFKQVDLPGLLVGLQNRSVR